MDLREVLKVTKVPLPDLLERETLVEVKVRPDEGEAGVELELTVFRFLPPPRLFLLLVFLFLAGRRR